jgi:hypothetical protein
MVNMKVAVEIMIEENNVKLKYLREYEQDYRHHFSKRERALYYAIEHEIAYLEKENKELTK